MQKLDATGFANMNKGDRVAHGRKLGGVNGVHCPGPLDAGFGGEVLSGALEFFGGEDGLFGCLGEWKL